MPDNDSIRLNLDVESTSAIVAAQNTDLLGGALARARDEYGRTEEAVARLRQTLASVDTAQQHGNDLRVAEAVEQARAQRLMREALDETSGGLTRSKVSFASAAKVAGDWRWEILNAGRAAQDFAQGGVGGILNNIEGLLIKFPVAAGVVTAFATVLYVAYTPLKNFFTALVAGSNQVPEAASKLDRLSDSLAKNKKELDELKDKQSLTNSELAHYNELLDKQEALESALAVAKKRKADADALSKLKTQSKEEEESETAANLRESFGGGGQNKLLADITRQTNKNDPELAKNRAELSRLIREYNKVLANPNSAPDNIAAYERDIKAAEGKVSGRTQTNNDTATDIVTKAFKGDNKTLQQLIRATPAGKARDALEASSAGAREAGDKADAAFDAGNAAASQAAARRRAQKDYSLDVQVQFNKARADKTAKDAEAEKHRQTVAEQTAREDQRLNDETNRKTQAEADKAAREAPRIRKQSDLAKAGRGVNQMAGQEGIPLTPDQTLDAAKRVVDLVGDGLDQRTATQAALNELVIKAQKISQQLQQQNQAAQQIWAGARNIPVQSDTFFPGD